MAAFGLWTAPLLIAVGLSASFLSVKTRLLGAKIAAISIILVGALMVAKGAKTFF